MEKSKIGMIALSVLCLLLLSFTISISNSLTASEADVTLLQEENIAQVNGIQETLGMQISELENTLSTLQGEKEIIETQLTELNSSLVAEQESNAAEIAELESQLASVEEEIVEVEDDIEYLVDELTLASSFEYSIADNKLSKLFDGEIEFDSDDYDAEETFYFSGLIDINSNDYESNVYLVMEEDEMSYTFTFDSTLNTSLITGDETMKFDFLGMEVEISSWDNDEISFTSGTDYMLNHGENTSINGKEVEMKIVGEDYVYVCVDGDCEKVNEGTTENIGDLEIYCDFVLEGELAKIMVSDDIETTVENGDEYEEDSIWNWVITSSTLGIVLDDDFKDLDEDDEYHALGAGDNICLPNDYVCLTYKGISEEGVETFTFELDEKDGNTYVKAKGSYLFGLSDYDLLYINASGFYDEDLSLIVNETGSLILDDTELNLSFDGSDLKVDDVAFALNFTTLTSNSVDITGKDDNYRTAYGTIIESPEDNFEDSELSMVVPEEALTASVGIV